MANTVSSLHGDEMDSDGGLSGRAPARQRRKDPSVAPVCRWVPLRSGWNRDGVAHRRNPVAGSHGPHAVAEVNVLLTALKQIGEAIALLDFEEPYDRYYTPAALGDVDHVIAIEVDETADGLSYTGTQLRDAGDPAEMAHRHAFSASHKRDKSLAQCFTGQLDGHIDRVLDWPKRDDIGAAADRDRIEQLGDVFERNRERISADVVSYAGLEGDIFVTVRVELADGETKWPGDIAGVRDGVRAVYKHKAANKSAGTDNTGVTECAVCGDETDVFGGLADLDKLYTLKKQGRFPNHNASNAWQNRPFCIDCITAITTAWDRFVDGQRYGIPDPNSDGILRCRVFPYALPVEHGAERLAALIENGRDYLRGGTDDHLERPLRRAWDFYRAGVDLETEDDVLRLAIMHYVYDPSATRSYGLSWIAGIRQPRVSAIERTVRDVLDSGLFRVGVLPGIATDGRALIAPTERQVFTGRWAYEILARGRTETATNGVGQWPDAVDERQWLTLTRQLLTGDPVSFETIHSHVAAEMRARADPGTESDAADGYYSSPFDEFHVARVYTLLQTLRRLGLFTDHPPADTRPQPMDTFDTDYETLGAAVNAFIDDHEAIATSPGCTAAFILGVVAARLSRWQQYRGCNRTFLQTHHTESLGVDDLATWQHQIWETATTYNAQLGNYGIPWRAIQQRFSAAILDGQDAGWRATNDEVQTYFVMGATLGPRFEAVVTEDGDGDRETATPTEAADAP